MTQTDPADASASQTVHASTVAIGDRAVMIEGSSGAGKSDLALRLIDRGATLVSDDYTVLTRTGDQLFATPPATIAGRMEVRGLGIVTMRHREAVALALIVRLDRPPRMPEPCRRDMLGVSVREIAIDPEQPSAAIKVELALDQTKDIVA